MKKSIIYIIAAVCVFLIVLVPIFIPCLKNDDTLMLIMQGLNILVFLHISYMLATEDKNRYITQQKLDDERLHKQLKFDLVKKYIDEFDLYLKEIQKIKEFSRIAQFYQQEVPKFDTLIRKIEQENLKLKNIFNSMEYDRYIYIQSNLMQDYYKFKSLVLSLDIDKDYPKDDSLILDIDDNYINSLSHLSMLADYLYFILLHDSDAYEMESIIEILKRSFNKLKLSHAGASL